MSQAIRDDVGFNNFMFVAVERYNDLSDLEVIRKVLEGTTEFFEVIMRRYNQRLFRIQRAYISDEEAIKDTLQSTYIRAYENLSSFRGDAQFSTWITRIAINEAQKYLNDQKRYTNLKSVYKDESMDRPQINKSDTPENDTIQSDFKVLLEKLVDGLPPKYRSVYIMRELEYMNSRETAECLGLSLSNVKVRLHRANRMLSEELRRNINDTEIFDFMGERCDLLVLNVMMAIENGGYKVNQSSS